MNDSQLRQICENLNLGEPLSPPLPVSGGLLHRMWQVTTSKGRYAIKELNSSVKSKKNVRERYRETERIANAFLKRGIPAVAAYLYQDHPILEIEGAWFMVFDWVDGKILSSDEIKPEHARKIGEILFLLHTAKLSSSQDMNFSALFFPDTHWKSFIKKLLAKNPNLAASLESALLDLLALNQAFEKARVSLNNTRILSHADLDPKNVLWQNDTTPHLLDWESARQVNPSLEVIACALDWGGITVGEVNLNLYRALLEGYLHSGGKLEEDLKPSLYGLAGEWLAWLEFNLRRATGESALDAEEQEFGTKLALETIATLIRLKQGLLIYTQNSHII